MYFQVPQFIEIEDKIFGPLTFKQFIYLAGGAGAAFLVHVFLPTILEIIPILAIIGLALALAFYKINERPFVSFLESMFKYQIGGKLYLWQHRKKADVATVKATKQKDGDLKMPTLGHSRLNDLSWSLDIHETTK